MSVELFPGELRDKFEIFEWKHACAVLYTDFPEQWSDLLQVLSDLELTTEDVLSPGGGLSPVSKKLNSAFDRFGWKEKAFETAITVDGTTRLSPTHNVDCVKGEVALEIEWSNKDPFFDRDLNNFRLLFDVRAISAGVIITKSDELSAIFRELGILGKYGTASTWMKKLLPRVEGGGGGGCPLLVVGITKKVFDKEYL